MVWILILIYFNSIMVNFLEKLLKKSQYLVKIVIKVSLVFNKLIWTL